MSETLFMSIQMVIFQLIDTKSRNINFNCFVIKFYVVNQKQWYLITLLFIKWSN